MSLKIKAKGQAAIDLLGMKKDFRDAHKSQKDIALLNGDGSRGDKYMDENPSSRQAENTHASEESDITKKVKQTTAVNTSPEAQPFEGFEVVRPVDRELPVGMPERARRFSNQSRDMRTALGRGKSSTVVTE
jgi:hypothetical protein